jgi:hypothetical protein
LNYLLNIAFIIPYSKTKGAATIDATPIPISPRKNNTSIKPTQNPVTVRPSSKLRGIINRPIAEQANRASQNHTNAHLSFQYRYATIKQQRIKNKYVINNSVSA